MGATAAPVEEAGSLAAAVEEGTAVEATGGAKASACGGGSAGATATRAPGRATTKPALLKALPT